MTHPLRDDDNRSPGQKALDASVESPPDLGRQVALHKNSSRTAGEADVSAPRQFSSDEVLETLMEAVRALEAAGKKPVAAGVSARMRSLRPGFALQGTQYSTFRQILEAAQSQGLIELDEGPDDLTVSSRVATSPQGLPGEVLRTDLWRAILDWSDDARYVFARGTRKTSPVTGTIPSDSVAVPSVGKQDRLVWMEEFTAQQRDAEKAALEEAMREEDPALGFHRVVRSSEPMKRRWNRHLRARVIGTALRWASDNGIPESDILLERAPKGGGVAPTSARSNADDVALRQRVLKILSGMPLHELLRLPIPVEYTLTRL